MQRGYSHLKKAVQKRMINREWGKRSLRKLILDTMEI
jgi:hypothetical protein